MNTWRIVAIIFSLFSFGAIKESMRIFFSTESNIADNRASLIPIAIIMSGFFITCTVLLWKKALHKK